MKAFFCFATIAITAHADPYKHGGIPANVHCPPGFNLAGKKCEQTTQSPPQIYCLVGNLVGDQCVATAPMVKQCPLGSAPEGKSCTVVQTMPATTFCPPGFADEGNVCTTRTPLPLAEVCEIGHADGSGMCIHIETAEKVIRTFCPPGYYDEGKGCMKVTEYDCSPAVINKKAAPAPPPIYPIGKKAKKYGGGGYGLRMLGAKKFNIYAPPAPLPAPPPSKAAVPIPMPAPPILAPPPPTVQVIRQSCQRKDFAPPVVESHCPDGFVELGKKCQLVKRFPPMQKCSNGGPANACEDVRTVGKETKCGKGVLVGQVCQWKEPMPQEAVCPAGTHMTGKGDCQQTTAPLARCPPGTTLEGRTCIGVNIAEPIGTVTVPCTGKGCWNQ